MSTPSLPTLDPLQIAATGTTPAVAFDPAAGGVLRLEGESYPENSAAFYEPILDWVRAWLARPDAGLELLVNLRYFNTSSCKYLIDLFDILEERFAAGAPVRVTWRYRRGIEVMLENGREFAEDLRLPFTFEAYE